MQRRGLTSRILIALVGAITFSGLQAHAQDSGCRTGGTALADAYVLANPMYSYFLGELEPYVAANTQHFGANGDSVRCATALAQAFLGSAVQLYDPGDLARQQELNAQLGAMGISPGPQEATPSTQLFGLSMQLSRLARVLPAAAARDYRPLRTPEGELEELQMMAGQTLRMLLQQDPDMAAVLEPLVREMAGLEHQALRQAAERLASAR